jgi:hypothetical protein
MNQIIFGLKREYWEYRKLLIVMPLIVTGLFFLMTMAATWTQNFSDLELLGDKKGAQLEITTEQEKGDSSSVIDNKKSPLLRPGFRPCFTLYRVYSTTAEIIAFSIGRLCQCQKYKRLSLSFCLLFWASQ